MLRYPDKTFHNITLNRDLAWKLLELNHKNREVSKRHVAKMGMDMLSENDYFLPGLVHLAIAVPIYLISHFKNTDNPLKKALELFDIDPGIESFNGGHTLSFVAASDIEIQVQVQIYTYKNNDELGAIKRSFDKSRHRTGDHKMMFAGSTFETVKNKTGIRLNSKELKSLHNALGPIIKGFLIKENSSHKSDLSVQTAELTLEFASIARTYLDKINEAFKLSQITTEMEIQLRNAGLMGAFLFLMNTKETKGKAFNFLNDIFSSPQRNNGKKAATNFKKWLLSTDNNVNPKAASDKTEATLRMFEYYWNLYYKYGNSAVRNIIDGNEFIFKTSGYEGRTAPDRVVFAGLTMHQMQKFDKFSSHHSNLGNLQSDYKMELKKLQKEQV